MREVGGVTNLARSPPRRGGPERRGEAASRRALELVEPMPDGPEKADALIVQAYLRMLDRDNVEAIAMGRRGIAMGGTDPRAATPWCGLEHGRQLADPDRRHRRRSRRSRDEPPLAQEHGLDRRVASAYSVIRSALGEMYRFADADPSSRPAVATRASGTSTASASTSRRGRPSPACTAAGGPGRALATGVAHRAAGQSIAGMMALLALGRLRARRGDPDVWDGPRRGVGDGRTHGDAPAGGAHPGRARRGPLAGRRPRAFGR